MGVEDFVAVKPNKGLTSTAIDWLEWAIVKLMHDSKQPLHYLAGNFGPVDETPPLADLPVHGHLPVFFFFNFLFFFLKLSSLFIFQHYTPIFFDFDTIQGILD